MVKNSLIALFLLFLALPVFANNLKIDNIKQTGANTLSFDIYWENAWNDTIGHDAVWVFAKSRLSGEHSYSHTAWEKFSFENEQIYAQQSPDSKGFFIISKGNFDIVKATVFVQTKDNLPENLISLMIFGTEMVYVKKGSFWVGDGISSQNAFRSGIFAADTTVCKPFLIQNEDEIRLGNLSVELFSDKSGLFFPKNNIPAAYPKGFQEFYVMKYEISQEQYCAFLNTLSFSEQENRIGVSLFSTVGTFVLPFSTPSRARNGIVLSQQPAADFPAIFALDGNENGIFNEKDDGKSRACNFLSAADLLAFLDWAALSPMTEFEFEKICRGEFFSLKGDFAWATNEAKDAQNVLFDGFENESAAEKADEKNGIASFNSGVEVRQTEGGMRCGFAAEDKANRLQAGAAYCGAKEMSGNLWEQCVGISDSALQFEGKNGDGVLDSKGFSDDFAFLLTELRLRGGGWNSFVYPVGGFRDISVSARYYADKYFSERMNTVGGRGVRRK